MNNFKRRNMFFALSGIALNISVPNAYATNGIYLTGSGASSSGMGGAAIAFPQDVTSAVDNPAGLAELGSRVELNGAVIPISADSTFGSTDNDLHSRKLIIIPGFGVNYQIAPQWTFGVAVTGAGAASQYDQPVLPVPGAGDANASLVVVNTSPTITYKPLPNLSIGASLVIGVEQLRLDGIISPGPSGSLEPGPSHGNSYAYGIGTGVGVLWTPIPMVSLGASYFTKTWFTPLEGYEDDVLAPSNGHLDSPSRYGVGIAIRPLPGLTVALDYLRIEWASAAGYNTSSSFGYRNQNVGRVGVSYEINPKWTVRGGYSFANNHIDSAHTLANVRAPGISPRAVTVGATYAIDKSNFITGAFEYDIPTSIHGTGPSEGTNISTRYQVYTLGYTHKF